MVMTDRDCAGWSECLGMIVTERDCAGWSECSVWLWHRETAQDGVSAQYGCYSRERERRMECSVWS